MSINRRASHIGGWICSVNAGADFVIGQTEFGELYMFGAAGAMLDVSNFTLLVLQMQCSL